MLRKEVKSSTVKSVGYDPKAKLLEIEFNSLAIYQYKGVPAAAVEKLLKASSIGGEFMASIRPAFEYVCIYKPPKPPKEGEQHGQATEAKDSKPKPDKKKVRT